MWNRFSSTELLAKRFSTRRNRGRGDFRAWWQSALLEVRVLEANVFMYFFACLSVAFLIHAHTIAWLGKSLLQLVTCHNIMNLGVCKLDQSTLKGECTCRNKLDARPCLRTIFEFASKQCVLLRVQQSLKHVLGCKPCDCLWQQPSFGFNELKQLYTACVVEFIFFHEALWSWVHGQQLVAA